MLKIIHFNYNIASNVNVGDEAHVLAIQDMLHARQPHVEFVNWPIGWLSQTQLPGKLAALPRWVQHASRVVKGNYVRRLLREINAADMVLIGGGGVYIHSLLPLHRGLIEGITAPIVLFGVGYNHNFGAPEFSPAALDGIIALGKKAKLQSVRDAETQHFLQALGVPSTLVADPAMFLEPQAATDSEPPPAAPFWRPAYRARVNRYPVPLEVNVLQNGAAGGGSATALPAPKQGAVAVGLNIAAHGWKQQQAHMEKIVQAYAEFARTLAASRPVQFYYFVHHPGELAAVAALKARGVQLAAVVQGNARAMRAAYAGMDVVVSMMLHSAILAFGAGVPTVAVGYDTKNRSFMELTGQQGRYIDVQHVTAPQLVQAASAVLAHKKTTAAALASTKATLRTRSDAFTEQVVALLNDK